jgi:hypothetical protein
MGWFKIYYPLVLLLVKLFAKKEKKKPAPPAHGKNASPQEKEKSKKMTEKRKQADKQQKAEDNLKLVISGAKVQCTLCTCPVGTLMVTDLNPTIQNIPAATITDNKKTSLLFTGTCTKSPNSSVPCIAIIQPGQWQKTGSLKVQDKAPLLAKSTVKCMYGSTDIKFMNSGQMKPPFGYDAPGPEKKSDPEERIDIRISVFFDGTGNNKTNTECRLEYEKKKQNPNSNYNKTKAAVYEKKAIKYEKKGKTGDDSYENDYSNVARLYQYYKNETGNNKERWDCVYIEGIGTTDMESDGSVAQGLGYSVFYKTGIRDKVKIGCQEVAKKINDLASKKKISTLTIDVFGFSRGAAAARNFLHEITLEEVKPQIIGSAGYGSMPVESPGSPAAGELGRYLKNKNITYSLLNVSFAGLFDTVAAYGIIKAFNVSELGLAAVKHARTALHLTAMDERRKNFILVTVKNSKGSASEKALPGVHSDIGGCYTDKMTEKEIKVFSGTSSEIEDEKKFLIRDGWYLSNELQGENTVSKTLQNNINAKHFLPHVYGVLKGTRKGISNKYSFIPLHIMHNKAIAKPVYMTFKSDQLTKKFKIPSEIEYINSRLNHYVFNGAPQLKFHTREELEIEISKERKRMAVKKPVTNHKSSEPKEKWNPYENLPKMQNDATRMATLEMPVLPLEKKLDPDEFPNNPVLQLKIMDHNHLLALRNKYLHMSHKCSDIKDIAGIDYMDPYSQSSRAAVIRDHQDG